MKTVLITLFATFVSLGTLAQESNSPKKSKELRFTNKFTLGTDLIQPFLLGGVNLNATYTTNRLIFDWSHGQNLTIGESLQSDEQKELDLDLTLPWTTGPGVGYRFTDHFDIRVDFKAHGIEAKLLNGQENLEYTAYTAGPGAYYRIYFSKKSGLGVELSARYWFELGNNQDGLDGSDYNFMDNAGIQRSFDTNVAGGFATNIAIIYTFGKNKSGKN